MRRDRGQGNGQFHGARQYGGRNVMNVTNITNITNVTQVTRVERAPHVPYDVRSRKRRNIGRPPKLQRYCETLGLVDGDVVARMPRSELAREAFNVVSYNARGCARDAARVVKGLGGACTTLIGGIFDAFVAAWS